MKLFYNESEHPEVINLKFKADARFALRPCPGCGTTANLELCNTHTSAYWIECESKGCGWQLHDAKATGATGAAAHRGSALRVFNNWNNRT